MVAARPQIVINALLDEIGRGTYPVGTLLPSEVELADRHAVSRASVRTALTELQKLGMIARQRGAGTTVVASSPDSERDGFNQSVGRYDDLVQYADTTRRVIQSVRDVVADFNLAERLGCKPGSRWLHMSTIRFESAASNGLPICWTELYAVDRYADLLRDHLDTYPGAAIALIEDRHGRQAAEIRQSISASGIPADIATRLNTNPGSHALDITRRYLDQFDNLIIATFSLHPSERFTYEMSLKRNAV